MGQLGIKSVSPFKERRQTCNPWGDWSIQEELEHGGAAQRQPINTSGSATSAAHPSRPAHLFLGLIERTIYLLARTSYYYSTYLAS
jgi:hypothetical protein